MGGSFSTQRHDSLHSDQGTNLCSTVVYSLSGLQPLEPQHATHMQGNSQIECFNCKLQSTYLIQTVDANQDTWDSQLSKAMFT